jgi:transcriptional regulator with XRE-family HTH domain
LTATPSDVQRAFGARVRELRTEKGISQEDLAFQSGLHRTYVSSVERGRRNVSLVTVYRIAAALDVPVAVLFWEP